MEIALFHIYACILVKHDKQSRNDIKIKFYTSFEEEVLVEEKTVQEWKTHIIPALYTKQSEFKLMGYPEITCDDIWACLEEKIWKGNPKKRLHAITQDIFHLSVSTYMSYLTVSALKEDDDLISSIQAVLKPND